MNPMAVSILSAMLALAGYPLLAQTEYATDGIHTPLEEEIRYYTMNLGSSGSTHFFTGTIFHDANGNGVYNQSEGVPGIRVTLQVNGSPHSQFDISTESGSFAIPIQSVPVGATVEVHLANSAQWEVQVSVPRDYHTLVTVSLASNQGNACGTFIKNSAARNVGFRDLTPVTPQLPAPRLTITPAEFGLSLSCPSETGALYWPQFSHDLITWHNLTSEHQYGDGADLLWLDPIAWTLAARRFYRVLVTPP